MKMLGFMIALTVVYWLMSSYAQTVIAGTEPCPVSLAAAIVEHEAVAERSQNELRGDTGQPTIRFEISPADKPQAGEKLAGLSSSASNRVCGG